MAFCYSSPRGLGQSALIFFFSFTKVIKWLFSFPPVQIIGISIELLRGNSCGGREWARALAYYWWSTEKYSLFYVAFLCLSRSSLLGKIFFLCFPEVKYSYCQDYIYFQGFYSLDYPTGSSANPSSIQKDMNCQKRYLLWALSILVHLLYLQINMKLWLPSLLWIIKALCFWPRCLCILLHPMKQS